MRPGGQFFAADFYQRRALTTDEWRVLHDEVACPSLPASFEAYTAELELAGFKVGLNQGKEKSIYL